LSLVLDLEEIASLAREISLSAEGESRPRSEPMVAAMDEELMDAVVRLTSLLSRPAHIPILAPLVQREIFYKLLLSKQGGLLCRIVAESGNVQKITVGLAWIRKNLTRQIRMEELARELRIGSSAMYSCFRAVTFMSPLQYQKQLRLQEARRLMLSESLDAGTVSFRVGYQSSLQFSREYRRVFGAPPLQDIQHLRAA
jgi:AraC-like DNA-binding protein